MSVVLQEKIAAVRRKHVLVRSGAGLAGLVGLGVLLLAVGMLLDYWIEFPWWVRAGLLMVEGAALGYVLVRYVLGPVVLGPDDEEVALMVERGMPAFRTRLIASVQLARPGAEAAGASQALVAALVRQTEEVAEPMDLAAVVKAEPLVGNAALAGFIVLLGGAAFVYGGAVSRDLLRRALLGEVPVPRQTQVVCLTGDRVVAVGEGIGLEALAKGVVPERGRVELRYDSGRAQGFSMEPVEGEAGRFVRGIENVQESFAYSIRLNDGRSAEHRVKALPRPVVVGMELEQVYPKYTGRSVQRRAPGDLVLLAGSELRVQAKMSKPIQRGAIQLVGLEREVAMAVGEADRTLVSGVIPVPAKGLSGFSIRVTDGDGIGSKGETIYPVDVVADREPVVRVLWPDRKEELATQQAQTLVSFEAGDDFGIGRVRLHYRVDRPVTAEAMEAGPEKRIELDLSDVGGEGLRLMRRRYEMELMELQPMPLEGCVVEYWLEVEDGNDVTGPGRVFSERYRVRVVSEVAKRADLMNRLNEQLGTIDQVTQDEEKLNQNLGRLIGEKGQTLGEESGGTDGAE